MVARLAVAAQELSGEDVPARVAPPAWAAALHNPAPATTVRGILSLLRAGWVTAAQRMRDAGRLPPGADVDAAGAVLFALLPGFLLQHLILGGTDAATLQRGLRQLLLGLNVEVLVARDIHGDPAGWLEDRVLCGLMTLGGDGPPLA